MNARAFKVHVNCTILKSELSWNLTKDLPIEFNCTCKDQQQANDFKTIFYLNVVFLNIKKKLRKIRLLINLSGHAG